MGIDLGGLNPWSLKRRRKWKQKYEANPLFSLESPMEATALLITATAKADGDMSADEKREMLRIFENEFHLSKREAAGLLTSSVHLYGRGDEVRDNMKGVLASSLDYFSAEQANSAIELVNRVASVGGSVSEMQKDIIQKTQEILVRPAKPRGAWD